MPINVEIDDALMAEAHNASEQPSRKQIMEQALRLMIRLRSQRDAYAAFGKYRRRGRFAQSRQRR
jgi:Arc/MetJ family transcription regulator